MSVRWATAGKRVHFFEVMDGETNSFSVLADDSLVQQKINGSPVLLLAELSAIEGTDDDFVKKVLALVEPILVSAKAKRFSEVFRLGCEGAL